MIAPEDIRLWKSQRRSTRVIILLVTIALLSLGDLYATVTHAKSIGMYEVNPLASILISMGDFQGLIAFKFLTAGMGIYTLLKIRHYRVTEKACWAMTAIMIMLTVHWYQYNMYISQELDHDAMSKAFNSVQITEVNPQYYSN